MSTQRINNEPSGRLGHTQRPHDDITCHSAAAIGWSLTHIALPQQISCDLHPRETTVDLMMDPTRRSQLIRQRSVAKSSLTCKQTLIESGDCKVNEIQVRSDNLQGIFDRYDTAQNELELLDDTDHFGDRELFENQYYEPYMAQVLFLVIYLFKLFV